MSIYNYESAFGANDKTSRAMRRAIERWFGLYYGIDRGPDSDPSERIACAVVGKLVRSVFGEYSFSAPPGFVRSIGRSLDDVRREALQLALVGGECWLKPCFSGQTLSFNIIPRNNVLIFGRAPDGTPTDIGTVERSVQDGWYYTLLERRTLCGDGRMRLTNDLYRSRSSTALGEQVALASHHAYSALRPNSSEFELDNLGLVHIKTPLLNCVDGSKDGVSVYAPAVGLIEAVERNDALLEREFEHGQSRILVSRDMLRDGQLSDSLFVGLDDDPEHVGLTVFAPPLRQEAFFARKQECLRSIESLIGLKRGMLCEANLDQRTATEISSSTGEYSLTVMDFQEMWEKAVHEAVALCVRLGRLYIPGIGEDTTHSIDWGNGVLYDEEKTWQGYLTMVEKGLLRPEIALGWRFNMPTETEAHLAAIRRKFMPDTPAGYPTAQSEPSLTQ